MGEGDTVSRVHNLGTTRRQEVRSVNRGCVGDRQAVVESYRADQCSLAFFQSGNPWYSFFISRGSPAYENVYRPEEIANFRTNFSAMFRGIFKDFSRYFKSFVIYSTISCWTLVEKHCRWLLYVCMYVCIYVCMYVCTYVCMYFVYVCNICMLYTYVCWPTYVCVYSTIY